MSESEGHTYAKEHQLSGEAILLDLQGEGQSLLEEARQSSAGRAARTLIKEGALRLTLLALKEGAGILEHRAGGPVSIQVLVGAVTIGVGQNNKEVAEQQALVLDTDVAHSVLARRDSVILLGIAMPG